MRTAIRKHLRDFLAIVALAAVAAFVGIYILGQQGFRFPLLSEKPFKLKAELDNAQAVTPGQGQTVQVAGVRIGKIANVKLVDGRAVVGLDIKRKYDNLIHTDATALLRPRTGLKDMFLEVSPGTPKAPLAKEGFAIPIQQTFSDVDLDEITSSLDSDTRDYLQLLIDGAGEGLRGRGSDLAETFRRFGPTFRDLGRVNRSVAKERVSLKHLIHSLALLNGELAGKDDELAQLVDASAATFRAFASEDTNLSRTVGDLPGTLRQATGTLGDVRSFAEQLGPTADSLIPAFHALNKANKQVRPFAEEATPILRDQIRPFVRTSRPLVRDLRPAAAGLANATPNLTSSFVVLNHLFNMLGYNQNGREGPDAAGRDEGYLFWIAWVTHQTVNLINTDDANGPLRPVLLTGTCSTLTSLVNDLPGLEFGLNLSPVLGSVCGNPQTTSIDVAGVQRTLAKAARAARVAGGGAG